jgi:hypothetical protein
MTAADCVVQRSELAFPIRPAPQGIHQLGLSRKKTLQRGEITPLGRKDPFANQLRRGWSCGATARAFLGHSL